MDLSKDEFYNVTNVIERNYGNDETHDFLDNFEKGILGLVDLDASDSMSMEKVFAAFEGFLGEESTREKSEVVCWIAQSACEALPERDASEVIDAINAAYPQFDASYRAEHNSVAVDVRDVVEAETLAAGGAVSQSGKTLEDGALQLGGGKKTNPRDNK